MSCKVHVCCATDLLVERAVLDFVVVMDCGWVGRWVRWPCSRIADYVPVQFFFGGGGFFSTSL